MRRQAAGEKDVLVHGAAVAQLALAAGILDELHIHLIPVLLGQGRRLFDHMAAEQIELEPHPDRRGTRRHPPPVPRRPLTP